MLLVQQTSRPPLCSRKKLKIKYLKHTIKFQMHIAFAQSAKADAARPLRVLGRFEDRPTTLETRSASIVLVDDGTDCIFSIKAVSRQTASLFVECQLQVPAALQSTEIPQSQVNLSL